MTLKINIVETDQFKFWLKVAIRAGVLFMFTVFSTSATFYGMNSCLSWNILISSMLTAGLYFSAELMRYYNIPQGKKGLFRPFIFE